MQKKLDLTIQMERCNAAVAVARGGQKSNQSIELIVLSQ